MNKLWGIGGIVGLALLAIIAFGGKEQPFAPQVLTVGSGFERGCTASTTAWSVGPQESKTVLPARGLRATFSLTTTGVNTTSLFRLDSTAPTVTNADIVAASSTKTWDETYPYRGVVTAGAVASTTLIVTECLYTN